MWAWVWLATTIPAAVVAQVVGHVLAAGLGYSEGDGRPPLGASAVLVLVTLVITTLPCCLAIILGVRAGRGGRVAGWVAAVVGGVNLVFWGVTSAAALLGFA